MISQITSAKRTVVLAIDIFASRSITFEILVILVVDGSRCNSLINLTPQIQSYAIAKMRHPTVDNPKGRSVVPLSKLHIVSQTTLPVIKKARPTPVDNAPTIVHR